MNLILVLAPVFLFLFTRASALLIPRADINGTLVPSPCISTCQSTISFQSKCGSDLKCRCTDANAKNFADCVDCILGFNSGSLAQNAAQSVLDEYVDECRKNNITISSLTLSLPGPTASPTGSLTSGAPRPSTRFSVPSSMLTLLVVLLFMR
ncbi:hypothetical protein R3P38DRAFT_3155577 [Favolaschia claudopus]|uniref:Extracellular membrane protein CFEM domain-containing protein n=1 Tax=Favolaschia claudopus TaxID=2862362 RepID=A0AAV9YYX8_9AGAR